MANHFVDKLRSFADLGPADVSALRSLTAMPRQYPAKHDLIREGDQPGSVFVMIEGWACRYNILPRGSRQITAFMMPGDYCDLHVNMIAQMDHSIQTVTRATVATIARADMDALLVQHPAVARALYAAQLVDEAVLRSWIVSMGRRGSVERVAHLMCELFLRSDVIGEAWNQRIPLPLSQVVLADALGMTPVHINRVLKELRLEGAMHIQRGQLVVTNPSALARRAGFDDNYLHRRAQLLTWSKTDRQNSAPAGNQQLSG